MKNKIIILIIIIGIFAYWGFSAKYQYSWSQRFQKETGTDWVVFDEQKNSAEIIYPYTFFKPPVNRLGLIQKSSIKALADQAYQYKLMWADGPLGNSMPTEVFLSYSDCKLLKEGSLREGFKEYINPDNLQWKSPDDNPYITSEKDKKKLIETFNRKCTILNTFKQ